MAIASKVKAAVANGFDKTKVASAAATTAVMVGMSQVMPVFCALNPDGIDIETIIGSILGIILTIAMYVGVVLLTYAIFQLVMSFKNDDAEGKSRATQLLVVSAVLIGLKKLMSVLLSKIGITIVMPS